jgi:DNA repair protein RadC
MHFDKEEILNVPQIELKYSHRVKPKDRLVVTNSQEAYNILKTSWDENKIELIEQFKILLLDRRGGCLGVGEISSGGSSCVNVDFKILFGMVLKANSPVIILAHNHPSGALKESPSDVRLTKDAIQAAKLLDIIVRDHIILTSESYYSFSDKGLMPI